MQTADQVNFQLKLNVIFQIIRMGISYQSILFAAMEGPAP